jgi:tetratricopeptide (TPR) repeat protein
MVRATVGALVLWATVTAARADDDAARQLGRAFAAYDAGDLAGARAALTGLTPDRLANPDYLLWLRGQIALLDGQPADAAVDFAALMATPDSRFARAAAWRAADAAWEQGQRADAAAAYQRLRAAADADEHADLGVVAYRIALAAGDADPTRGQAALRGFLRAYPTHPLAADADRALAAAGAAPTYSDDDRIERAQRMISAHAWDGAVAELAQIDARAPKAIRIRRDYWLGTALFKMRRRYADAGKLLLGVADDMRSAEALFHGARALSRADHDDDAIRHYREVVKRYPKTAWAEEAQYLTGWLEFNRGDYRAAIAPLAETIRRYPKSKWMDDALWFLGMSHYLVGDPAAALPHLAKLAARSGSLEAGKGAYWQARALDALHRDGEATPIYQRIVGRWPFSWYALLATARLAERGVTIGPFGTTAPTPRGPAVADAIDPAVTPTRRSARSTSWSPPGSPPTPASIWRGASAAWSSATRGPRRWRCCSIATAPAATGAGRGSWRWPTTAARSTRRPRVRPAASGCTPIPRPTRISSSSTARSAAARPTTSTRSCARRAATTPGCCRTPTPRGCCR